jgi:hypothetical protein
MGDFRKMSELRGWGTGSVQRMNVSVFLRAMARMGFRERGDLVIACEE